jgi:outer membrane protein assembly factor BamB
MNTNDHCRKTNYRRHEAGERGQFRQPSFVIRHSSFALLTLACTANLLAADWPQWRGPNRDGHAPGATLLALPKDPKPVWKIDIGAGLSSPVVGGGSVIYLDEQDKKEVAHRIDAATGKEIWRTPVADAAGDEWGSGPRSTPFVDGDRVYVQSISGEFRCLDFADGKVRWGISFKDFGITFQGSKANDGTASRRGNNGSGVIDGDHVYLPVGARGASVVCLDKLTGKTVWKSLNDEAAYSSFLVANLAGTRQLVAFTADALAGLDLQTGKQLWRVPYRTGAKRHAATPVINGDLVSVNSQTIGMVASRIAKAGDAFTATEQWLNKPLTVNLASPVLVDGHLYSYGPIRTKDYVCVDANTGATRWTQGGFGIGKDQTDYASTIAVGKSLLILTYDGQLVLIAANPAKYTELGRVQACGKTWSHPAYADGKLYVRDGLQGGHTLRCLDLGGK